MKTVVIGAGAMGSVLGGLLAKSGHDVTLVDIWREAVERINADGLKIEDKTGVIESIAVKATDRPAEIGPADLVLVFVKCYDTESAVQMALPVVGPNTTVLSLQNGWGNGPRIARIIGVERLLLGVCYHSATVLGPGHVLHGGKGMTFIGEADGQMTARLQRVAEAFNQAGIEVSATPAVRREIWSKLALNACTLPTSATLRMFAPQLLQTEDMRNLMRELLKEVAAVAQAQGIPLDLEERWQAITGLLQRLAPTIKGSMLQDVEKRRRTEIDVINGAIVEAGLSLRIPTPYNQAMVWMVRALESTYATGH